MTKIKEILKMSERQLRQNASGGQKLTIKGIIPETNNRNAYWDIAIFYSRFRPLANKTLAWICMCLVVE